MSSILETSAVLVASYLVGSLGTAYYVVRFKTGQDIRQLGTGTVGARNVGRVLGKWWAVLVFAGDLGKGLLAVGAAELALDQPWAAPLALVFVILGHVYPPQLRFHGGKGVATAAGGMLILSPLTVLAAFAVFALLLVLKMRSKESGLIVIAFLPIVSALLCRERFHLAGIVVAALLLLLTHRKDISAAIQARWKRESTEDAE